MEEIQSDWNQELRERERDMRGWLFTAVLSALASVAGAGEPSVWVSMGETGEFEIFVRKRSMEFVPAGDDWAAIVTSRRLDKPTGLLGFGHFYVKGSDCRRGFGTIVTTDIHGTFLHENDFVLGGETIGSDIAELLCAGLGRWLEQMVNKRLTPL